jgi:hypothetical protein
MRRSTELKKLQEIADAYLAKGYQVTLQPDSENLPKFLEGTRPDLIARSGDDSVLVEVKVGTETSASESYQELANRVKREKGWRFRLVIVDPKSTDTLPVDDPILKISEIEARLDQTRALIGQQANDAALLLGWTLLEGMLRLLAQRDELPLEQAPVELLSRELYSQGVISADDLESIKRMLKIRNGIAHGFSTRAGADLVEELNQLLDRLFDELRASEIGQPVES